jgi:pyridoxamine 5'-phosphate oxidase family protein
MSVFTESELDYLRGGGPPRLARIATVGEDGTPHVVPVGFRYEPAHDSIDVNGRDLERTKKYRDVERTGRAAIVIDDLASTDPWRPRGVEVRGQAEVISSPRPLIRIHPERIVSWGVDARGTLARGTLARSVESAAIETAAQAG